MAIWYANSITGNNGNSGATMALAKATLAGASGVASNGDFIDCHGIFTEALPIAKSLTWRGVGQCVLDGGGVLAGATLGAVTITCIGMRFRGFTNHVFYTSNAPTLNLLYCEFADQPIGVNFTSNSGKYLNIENCVFSNHTTYAVYVYDTYTNIRNSVFVKNAVGIQTYFDYYLYNAVLSNNVFLDPVMVNYSYNNGSWVGGHNVYDFTNGKCIRVGVDKTSLADWRTSQSSEYTSQDRQARSDLADYTGNVFRSSPSSYLLTAGAAGGTAGVSRPAAVVSNNVNASLWTGGTFSNTEIDGSGNLVLSAGQTLGTWTSGELDLGAAIALRSIQLRTNNETSSTFVDSSIADSPGYLTVELRGSNTSPVSGSYTAVPRQAEIGAYMTSTYRYWQIKLTLRA